MDKTSFDATLNFDTTLGAFPRMFLGGSRAMGWATGASDWDLYVATEGAGLLLEYLAGDGYTISFSHPENYVCTAKKKDTLAWGDFEFKFLEVEEFEAVKEEYRRATANGSPTYNTNLDKISNYRKNGIMCRSATTATLLLRTTVADALIKRLCSNRLRDRMPLDRSNIRGWPFPSR